jgi:hypothetical protein
MAAASTVKERWWLIRGISRHVINGRHHCASGNIGCEVTRLVIEDIQRINGEAGPWNTMFEDLSDFVGTSRASWEEPVFEVGTGLAPPGFAL